MLRSWAGRRGAAGLGRAAQPSRPAGVGEAKAHFEMRRIHSPILLANVEDAKTRAFVLLFTCDAFARAIVITLVPLQAYALLDAAQVVSVVYFVVAIAGLAASLTVPVVLHWVRRRWVLTIGAAAQMG